MNYNNNNNKLTFDLSTILENIKKIKLNISQYVDEIKNMVNLEYFYKNILNPENIILLLIIIVIIIIHIFVYNNAKSMSKILIIFSIILFVVIILEHIIYSNIDDKNDEILYKKSIGTIFEIYRLPIKSKNKVFRLLTQLLKHPIFYL